MFIYLQCLFLLKKSEISWRSLKKSCAFPLLPANSFGNIKNYAGPTTCIIYYAIIFKLGKEKLLEVVFQDNIKKKKLVV